jgi:hypothetical protein
MSAAHARGNGAQCAEECGEECSWGGTRLRDVFARAASPPGSPEQTWGQWESGFQFAMMGVCVAASGESARAGDAAEAADEAVVEEEGGNRLRPPSPGASEAEFESQKWGDGEWWDERRDDVGEVWTEEDEFYHPTKDGLGPWWVEGSQEFPRAARFEPAASETPESPVGSPQSDTEVAEWWGRDSAVAQGRGEEGRGEERAAAADVAAGTGQAPNADPPPPSPR